VNRASVRSGPADPTQSPRRALWGLFAAGAAGFIALALVYEHDPLASLDEKVARWVATSMPAWAEALARPPSWLGGWIGMTVLAIAISVMLVRERSWVDLAFLLTAIVGSQIVVAVLKAWFERPRPDVGSAIALPSSASFPSGHATAAVAGFGAAAVVVAERLPARARVWVWTAVIAGGLAVGLSRIVLNVHYVTDVLAGGCLGLAWLAACLLVRSRAR
jgi:membrane-associated phospholipid phosphatase